MSFLYEQLEILRNFGSYTEIPSYIKENVNPSFILRPYQINAFENFITYFENNISCLLYHARIDVFPGNHHFACLNNHIE